MELQIPFKKAQKFNEEVVPDGTPIFFKYEVNDHYFNALVEEYGPQMLKITNGHWTRLIEIAEVVSGICEIKPVFETKAELILPCTVFDHENIPPGSILIDCDKTAFIVSESDPSYIEIRNHTNHASYIQADVFFTLDAEEIDAVTIIPPESWIIDKAEAYHHAVTADMTLEEAEEYLRPANLNELKEGLDDK